jgi:hypothetical protein
MTVVMLVVVPEIVLESRRPAPEGAPVPSRFLSATRCYHVSFDPPGFGLIHGRVFDSLHLRDSTTDGFLGTRPDDIDDTGKQTEMARTRVRWAMAGTDSIQVQVPFEWYFGLVMRLSLRSDTLYGRAWTVEDVQEIAPGATVRAEPVSCVPRN